jgi:hypothetical protein
MSTSDLRFESGYDAVGDVLYFSAAETPALGAEEDAEHGLLWRFDEVGVVVGVSVFDARIRRAEDLQLTAAVISQAIGWPVEEVVSAFQLSLPQLRAAGE